MYNIGLDIGYSYTKTDSGVFFPSKIMAGDNVINEGTQIIYNNQKFTIGIGKGTLELNKINSMLTKLCMLAAVAKSTDDDTVNIATGLPIGQIKLLADDLKNYLLNDNHINYTINNVNKKLFINDVIVVPQGARALYAYDIEGDVIIIDIGGRSVDIAYFEYINGKRKLVKYNTLYKGMISLYSKLIEQINKKYSSSGLSLDDEYGEKILTEGLSIFGDKQDLSWLQPVYDAHVEEIINNLMLNYRYVSTDIYICGGGAKTLFPSFKKKIKNIRILDDSQFSNAIGFKKIADSIWHIDIKPEQKVLKWAL